MNRNDIEKVKIRLKVWGRRSNTIEIYISHLKRFYTWLEENGYNEVTTETIEEYIAFLREQELSSTYIMNVIASLRVASSILRWQISWKDIKVEARPKFDFVVLDEEDVEKIIESAPNMKIKIMLKLGYEAALRSSELCRLKVRDVDLERKIVRVIPAKKRAQIPEEVPISDELIEMLKIYISYNDLSPNDALFPGKWKEQGMNPNYFTTYIFRPIVEALGLDAKYGKRIRYHDFARHTRATHLLRRGLDIYTVNRLLRHERLDTTMVYLHFVPEDIRMRLLKVGGL